MNRGERGKRPLRGRGHLPQGELIALGSKGSSKSQDISELKPLPPLKPISGSTSKKTGSSLPDRKRDSPSPLQPLRLAKRSKTSSPLSSPSVSIDIESSLRASPSSPVPPITPIEVGADELERKVLKAEDNNEQNKVDGYIMGALKILRSNRNKPDSGMYLSLFCLLKRKPHLFRSYRVVEFLTSLLKRDTSVNLKGVRPSPVIPIMACNILLSAFQDEQDWPESFIKVFVDDSLGDRSWIENDKCRIFVDNLLTAFSTTIPPRSTVPSGTEGIKLAGEHPTEGSISSPKPGKMDEEDLFLKEVECKESISPESEKISCRYESSSTCLNIHSYVVDLIKDQLTRRQLVDNTTRNLLRLMSSSCGLSEVKLLSSQRLEVWLQNPKLNRPAQELLMSLALNCNTHSMEDVEVISNIIKMRLKTKQLAAHYITCVRVLVEQHDDNLGTLIKHIIYNELSSTRNPNNMSLLSVLFQYDPEGAAKNLAHVFQDLLINREDYLRAVRALLREIVRALRHDLDFVALCRGLMRERKESLFQELESSIKERMFASVTDMITVTMLLSVTPSVRDDLAAFKRGDQRELKALHDFQKNVAIIQQDAASWLHTVVPHMFPISSVNYQQSLSKVLFMEPPESYASKDAWPSESERSFLLSVISDVPVMDDTLTRVTVIGLSPELPVDAAKALKYVETLVQRAAAVKSGVPPIKVNRLRFIDAVLDLCVYHYPPNIQLPAGYNPPSLAIANLYWTGWIVILVVAAFNPSNIGGVVWNTYPTIRCLMEMAMTNNFVYPPPTMVESTEHLEELQSLETQIAAAEKEDILLFETHLAAATSGKTITEDSSLLISQLISMVPDGPARKPPQYVIEQLKTLNTTIGIGKLFCRSRSPDFLLEIIQRQGASQSRPWLAELVLSSQESLDVLPVQCLCEFLLLQSPAELGEDEIDERNDKREETIKQVLSRLQVLLFGSKASAESTSEALECFMYRLHSRPTKERNAAERALSLIFSFNEQDEDTSSETYKWLLDSMPTLPYFDAVLSSLSHSLRKACAQELDFHRLQAYIIFLSKYSLDDFAEEVSVDLAHLLLERPAVFKNILSMDTKIANDTHVALLNVFSSVLTRALETNSAYFSWDDHQDPIYIRWSKDAVHGGKAATLGVYIIHASMVLLTFGPPREDRSLFDLQLNSWCPEKGNVKMFLPNSGEEILLLPDWLRLKMICSNVPRLVDKAFTNIEPTQLVLFAQSFGIPVTGTSKILEHLDLATDDEPTLLNQIIIDKSYMLQLISVHRSRGAVGGQRFCELLNDGDVECYAKPFKEERVTPLRSSRHSAEPDEYMAVDANSSEMIKDLVVKIFPFGSHRKTFSARDQTHYGFQLQKTISKEVSHLHKGVDISSTMTEQFIKIMIRFLESEDGSSFSKVFFNSPRFAHPYLRMLIARETILEKQGDNSLFPYLMDLLFQRKIANGPVSSLVTKYHRQPYSKHRKTCAEASLDKIREQVKRVQSGESLTNNEIKEIITGLKNPKNQNIKPTELMSVLSSLQSSTSPLLEEFLRSLISLLLTRTAQTPLAETNQFIQDMIGSLRARCDVRSRAANGAILDWLPVLDPDIANICPLKQRQLLFGSSDPVDGDRVGEGLTGIKEDPTRIKEDLTGIREDRDVSQGLLLLVLLTHSGSWNKLQDSLDWLLSQDKDTTRVDPTAALRFVESCLSIPQLWQGRDTKSAKGIETSFNADTTEGEILNLSTDQLSCVVMYILVEAERLSRKTDLSSDSEIDNLLETRVSLLLRCSKGKEKNLCSVVERLENDSRLSKELRQRFLIQLYLYLPELLSWVKDPESLLSLDFTAKAKFGKFDGFFHRMISILSECQSGKVWEDRITGVVLLCRKMASLHPAHILRNLPMISSLLRGRTHLTSKEFYNQNHFLFFTHILGLLDSLRPYIFDSSKFIQDGLLDTLDSFLDLVQSHCIKQKERAGVVAKLVEFLQHFLTHNPTSALEYLQTKIDFLEDLLSEHSELSSLQSLLAVLSVPRTLGCDQSELKPHDQSASKPQDKVVPSSLLVMTPVTTPWTPAQIEPFLQRIGPNQPVAEVRRVLDDLDETSRRRIDILQFFLQDMARLTKDVNEACRAKAHSLLMRHLKQNPRDSRLIIDCYLECLSSTDPEVILSAAKVLPEIAILSAESADQLLEKAFTASTQKLAEVGTYITRTLQLFNME